MPLTWGKREVCFECAGIDSGDEITIGGRQNATSISLRTSAACRVLRRRGRSILARWGIFPRVAKHLLSPSPRADRLDALRGLALVWMAAFHFCFDLKVFGFLQANFYTDPLWTRQRVVIVSLFLFCAGVGQVLAAQQGQTGPRFWRRWGQIAACALVVTVASRVQFPNSYISFGVLHAMALMLLAARVLCRFQAPAAVVLACGVAVVVLGNALAHPFFDSRLTNWLGFVTFRPPTEDYVPLFPWFGVMLWGVAAGQYLLQHQTQALYGPLPVLGRPLWRAVALLGRWSLSFYMLHQVVLMGALMTFVALVR